MSLNLRKRTRISYYEPDEPSFDEYLYCDQCLDFVYDYCAIHGPLLVIPDDKVPVKTNLPAYVPRAALTVPHVFLHLAPSVIPGAGLGVFSTLTLPRGVRFGPYCGQRTEHVDSMYCWQIYDRNNKRSHVIDAVNSDRANWMRYVNCARHWKEQNLLAYQYKGRLYYRTIKIIPRFTELMVFYGSEYANALHINLAKYNSAEYYREIISVSTKPLNANKESIEQNDFTEDQFHFIDEDTQQIENDKNLSELTNQEVFNPSKPTVIDKKLHKAENNSITDLRHECETCKKTFASAKYLKDHKLIHLNTWKYNCEFCYYKTNYTYRFKLHIGQHTNTYKFSCDNCLYKTNYKRSLKRHCLIHTKEQKYRVTGPNNSSTSTSSFSTPKICDTCDFRTLSRKSFALHVAKHKGFIYKCDHCSYCSYCKYNLSRHIMRNHK